jgi:hypothetical protein
MIERQLSTASMDLASVSDKLISKRAEIDALVSSGKETESSLAGLIEDKKKELALIKNDIENRLAIFNDEIKKRTEAVELRESSVTKSEQKNISDAKQNQSFASTLIDREKELKLLELKIKELARKKDIDAQIASLSK